MGDESSDLLMTMVADRSVGFELHRVVQIIPMLSTIPIPGGPPALLGFFSLGGQPIPVFQLRTLFGLPAEDNDVNHRIVLLSVEDRSVGLVVDEATGLRSASVHRSPSRHDHLTAAEAVKSMAIVDGELCVVLDSEVACRWLGGVLPESLDFERVERSYVAELRREESAALEIQWEKAEEEEAEVAPAPPTVEVLPPSQHDEIPDTLEFIPPQLSQPPAAFEEPLLRDGVEDENPTILEEAPPQGDTVVEGEDEDPTLQEEGARDPGPTRAFVEDELEDDSGSEDPTLHEIIPPEDGDRDG